MGDASKGFEEIRKLNRRFSNNARMADVVRVYWENGYTFWQNSVREYFLMLNEETGEKVRLYYNGRVIEG